MNSIEKLQQTERKLRDSYIDCSHSCERDTLALGRAIRDGNSATTTELINRLKGLVTAKFTSRIESFLLDFKSLFLEFSGSSPRACVKIAHSGSQDEGVVTLVCRDTPRGYSTSYRISEHTGFAQVNFTMEAYLENNIPNKVVDNLYNNPRIDPSRIPAFREEFNSHHGTLSKLLLFSGMKTDQRYEKAWKTIWRQIDNGGNLVDLRDVDCYKSTLILPITMADSQTNVEFEESFFDENIEKDIVFGYLCFDHNTIGYFDKSFHVPVSQSLSYWLCMYFLRMITCIRSVSELAGDRCFGKLVDSDADATAQIDENVKVLL